MRLPTLVRAADAADLLKQVEAKLEAGMDLYSPLYEGEAGGLCQWMVESAVLYEYRLVIANDLDDYELEVRNLTELGFDFVFSLVLHQGKFLQWMCKMTNFGQTVKAAVTLRDAERTDELQLVEDVRAVLRLAPVSPDEYALTIPFLNERDVAELGEHWLHTHGATIPDILLVDGVPLR